MPFYRILLMFYPAAFRAQYDNELAAIFQVRLRDTHSSFRKLLLYFEIAIDVLLTAAATHWDLLRSDVRYTLRTWRRSPGFVLAAVAVAALGIGATTAVYTVTDYVLLRPLPYQEVDRLVLLWQDMSPGNYSAMEPSPANFRDWKRLSRSFSDMAASRPLSIGMTGVGEPQQIDGACVTANLFPMLGARPLLGRSFSSEDDRAGAPGTILLSYGIWQSRFAGDPSVVGRTILLDGDPYQVIGVMPQGFSYPRQKVELWTTTRFKADDFLDRNDNYLRVLAKLRPGVSVKSARSEMARVSSELKHEYPVDNAHVAVNIVPFSEQIPDHSRVMLLALLGAGFCVLLIACANLANLLLARALARQKEIAVRNALGAGRERLVRQLLTESLLLSAIGGVLGVGLATACVPLLGRLVPDSLPVAGLPAVDSRVLLFALALVVLTGLVFGLLPGMRAVSAAISSGLSEGSRSGVGGRKERLRQTLVIAEVSISFVLLVACGLLMRTLWHLNEMNPGFQAQNVLSMRTVLPMPRYQITSRRLRFYDQVLSGIRALPGVQGAAYTSFLPFVMHGGIWPVSLPGHDVQLDRALHQASLRFVTPDYFRTMGTPLLQGRSIRDSDTANSQSVAVVSRSFVQEYWPHQDPIGRHFTFGFADRQVVGVVGNVLVRGREGRSEPQVYLSWQQVPDGAILWYHPKDLVIRSNLTTAQLLPAVRRIIANADPLQPISDVQSLSAIMADDSVARSTQARILAGFAVLAVVLATIGIHGLLSFTFGSRRQEIGVRMAIGASSRKILLMVARESAVLCLFGIALGLAGAWWAGYAISSLLLGASPVDLPTYAVALAIAVLGVGAGTLLPAIQALRVDPAIALRSE